MSNAPSATTQDDVAAQKTQQQQQQQQQEEEEEEAKLKVKLRGVCEVPVGDADDDDGHHGLDPEQGGMDGP